MNIAHPGFLKLTDKMKTSVDSYTKIREEILYEQDISPNSRPLDEVNFAKYILYNGTTKEKRDLITSLDRQLYIKDFTVTSTLNS